MRRPRGGKSTDAVLPEIGQPGRRVPRRVRVEGDLHQELCAALRRLQDPRLEAATVTRVEMSEDLRFARVLVRLAYRDDEGSARTDLMRALAAAGGRLRSHVGRTLKLRFTPELRFVYDEGPDAARRVDELLAEIHDEG